MSGVEPSGAREPGATPETTRVEPGSHDAAWDAYLDSRPESTFFHRSAWISAVERTFAFRRASIVARRDGRLCGVLPLHHVRLFPKGSALVSIPMSVYGGIVADDAVARRSLLEAAQEMAARERVDYLELRHLDPVEGLVTGSRYVTFRREIDPDADVNMSRIPRNQRRSIRVALKHGLRAECGGAERLDDFYDIYVESTRNLGSPVFPKALFRNALEGLGPACEILCVYDGARMVAGVMTFYHRDQVLPYYGGARRDAFRLACNDFMYWSLLCRAADRGLRIFDFGRSKKESGSYHFKRHWGFEPHPLAYQYHLVRARALPDRSPMNPRYALAIGLWKRVPIPVARWIGPRLVRFFP
ncbi:MAG: FemAB family XrtA/PEP-CTERM system-associated protein [bacterium]